MLKSLVVQNCFAKFDLEIKNLNHAYLFYSKDRLLNDEIATLFAMKIFCEKHKPCFECDACKRALLDKNPDFVIIDKSTINVEDVTKIIEESWLKPMIYKHKVVLIKNADNINELAQNKLLKTLEEPSASIIFILTTTNEDKLLATIKSRVKKIFLNFSLNDNLESELIDLGVDSKFINQAFTLSEIVENSRNEEYSNCLAILDNVLLSLKTTQDIPDAVAKLKITGQNKILYLSLLEKAFSDGGEIFSEQIQSKIKTEYSEDLKVKVRSLIEKAYLRIKSNVNVNYVFDLLFYEILKEKYLSQK